MHLIVKVWVDKGREFCNKRMQEWPGNNDTSIYSTNKQGKSVIAKRFIKHPRLKSI